MASGQRDFGLYAPTGTIVGLSDLGELAVRLGSIITHDRRGNVIWFDDFESGLNTWTLLSTIGADKPVWTADYAKSGGFCCKLHTSATAWNQSYIRHYMGIPVLSKFGLEVSFSLPSTNVNFYCEQAISDRVNIPKYGVEYDLPNKSLLYLGADNLYHTFATGIYPITLPYAFNTLKVVVDAVAKVYIRAIFNNTTYDLSAYSPYNPTTVSYTYHQAAITLENPAAEAKEVYIDAVIITQNEP